MLLDSYQSRRAGYGLDRGCLELYMACQRKQSIVVGSGHLTLAGDPFYFGCRVAWAKLVMSNYRL